MSSAPCIEAAVDSSTSLNSAKIIVPVRGIELRLGTSVQGHLSENISEVPHQ